MNLLKNILSIPLLVFGLFLTTCFIPRSGDDKILSVPSEFKSIKDAVLHSSDGDTIMIAPGYYKEGNILVNSAILITSEWKITDNKDLIEQTIIDAEGGKLFLVQKDGVEISGLKVINGDHSLDITAKSIITNNHFDANLDAISMEAGSGGYVAYNVIENDLDDGLDIDIGDDASDVIGSDIIVEYNHITNSNDDGIEIRLFSRPDQNINYTIRRNTITGSGNAGIQLISYDLPTGKTFRIHHNILKDCKTALGCMGGAVTEENLEGTSKMDEPVYFYNNTIQDNAMGATGGNTVYAFNNIVSGNELGGFKNFGLNSAIHNNLFYNNGDDIINLAAGASMSENLKGQNPVLDTLSLEPKSNSPVINQGLEDLIVYGKTLISVSKDFFVGSAPDLGAIGKGIQD